MEIGNSLIYTDSLPLLALPFKVFKSFLPQPFQFMGLWMMACFILQAVFAWKLIGIFTQDTWIQVFGTGYFILAPPFLVRMHGHESLMAHWLILAALLLYFSIDWKPKQWLVLLALSVLVHAYLCLLVSSIWLANQVKRLVNRTITAKQSILWSLGSFAVVLAIMWQAGYFMVSASSLDGGGYGLYRMNLLSLVHANGGWSVVFADRLLGPGEDEGFNFLGLGGVALLILMLAELLRDVSFRRTVRSLWPLLLLSAALTLYAISNQVALGETQLFTIPIPSAAAKLTGTFRASGRMFWPVFYLIYLSSIYVVTKRFQPKVAAAVLGGLLLLQAADCAEALKIIHKKLDSAKPWVSSLQSPFWREASRRYKNIIYIPPRNVPTNYFDLAYLAATNGMKINIGAFARFDLNKLRIAAEEQMQVINSGSFSEDSLYIFEQRQTWEAALPRVGGADRAGILDGYRVVAPKWSQCVPCVATGALSEVSEGIERVVAYRPGSLIDFSDAGNGQEYVMSGITSPEKWGSWTDGGTATLDFRLESPPGGDLIMRFGSYAYVVGNHGVQRVDVVVNGTQLGTFVFTQSGLVEGRVQRIPREVAMAHGGKVTLEFRLADAISPAEIGKSDDKRKLALGLVWMSFSDAEH